LDKISCETAVQWNRYPFTPFGDTLVADLYNFGHGIAICRPHPSKHGLVRMKGKEVFVFGTAVNEVHKAFDGGSFFHLSLFMLPVSLYATRHAIASPAFSENP
jgi:hypothetical protein